MLRLLAIAATAVNVMFGLGVAALTRGGDALPQVGLAFPAPLLQPHLLAVFLVGTGPGVHPRGPGCAVPTASTSGWSAPA